MKFMQTRLMDLFITGWLYRERYIECLFAFDRTQCFETQDSKHRVQNIAQTRNDEMDGAGVRRVWSIHRNLQLGINVCKIDLSSRQTLTIDRGFFAFIIHRIKSCHRCRSTSSQIIREPERSIIFDYFIPPFSSILR